MVTEEEAKSIRCPLAFSGSFSDYTEMFAGPKFCLGSKCMAWRWANQDRGYCGFAGKPTVMVTGSQS